MITKARLAGAGAVLALGAALGLLATGPTRADNSPYYLSLGIGTQTRENAQDRSGAFTKFNQGLVGSVAIGRHVGKILRLEVESDYFDNSNKTETAPGAPPPLGTVGDAARGNISLQDYFFNVNADIPIKGEPKLKPFVGAGIGMFQSQVHGLSSNELFNALGFVLDTDSDWQTAWQFKGGVAYQTDKNTDIYIDVRRVCGDRFELQSGSEAITAGTGQLFVGGPRNTAVDLGIRIAI